ncbi:MAG TPA: RNA polymerase sigma factor SigJ [Jiangellaceae bacterium]|nr:RNA polymerase sigma factor SigJ [Jiangellaceae bacterium]
MSTDQVELFEANRPRLFSLAYRMLGEASEAEDVVQDAYLRWADSLDVDVPEAWLTKVVTNLCLNRLTSARARREKYVGPWLPEPVVTAHGELSPLDTVERRDTVSFGVLVMLERLTPPERAVFILREAFGHTHREIAEILSIDEAHSRQLHRRARQHVGAARQRFSADRQHRDQIVQSLFAAVTDGNVAQLERLLADDVEAWADGGGRQAARRPVIGRERVARYLVGLGKRPEVAQARAVLTEVNAEPAAAHYDGDTLIGISVLEMAGDRVAAIRVVVNPDKLAYVARQLASTTA